MAKRVARGRSQRKDPARNAADDDRRYIVGAADADSSKVGTTATMADPSTMKATTGAPYCTVLQDHEAHVPEAVTEDRDEVGARHPHQERDDEEHEQRQEEGRGFGVVAEERSHERSDEAEEQARAGDRCHEDEETHLFSQGACGSAIALADRDHGGEGRDQRDDRAERDERA